MADQETELFMLLIDSTGNKVQADCRAQLNAQDTLTAEDFVAGCFFQLDDFKFGMNIDDRDPTEESGGKSGPPGGKAPPTVGGTLGPASALAGTQVKFGRWKSAADTEVKAMTFPVKMDEFTVTRRYDKASPLLFEKCANSEGFKKASIIKRRLIGGADLKAFLRIDLSDVLITHIDLEDEEVIKETLHMIFRGITITYKPQLHNGNLGPAGVADWAYDATLTQKGK
jgi:type VI secretion system Hcp family effector